MKNYIIKGLFALFFIIAVTSQCTTGTTSNGISCPACCTACHDDLTCTSCYSWRYFLNPITGTCQSCTPSQCVHCSYDFTFTSICTRCTYNYGLDTSTSPPTCAVCSASTAMQCDAINNCSGAGTCLNCYQAYIVIDNACRSCGSVWLHCINCITMRCTACSSGYYLNTTTNQTCVLCSAIPYCLACNNGPICRICASGYFRQNNVCIQCSYPCLTCQSRTSCQSCSTTTQQYLFYNNSCVHCWEHPSTANCSLCSESAGVYSCYNCLDRFYLFSSSSCRPCQGLCLTCSSALVCTSCHNDSYTIIGSQCELCNYTMANCLQCYDSAVCTECEPQFTVNITSPTTADCIRCELVYLHCLTCSDKRCLSCLEGYTIDSATSKCVEIPCPSPCLACQANDSSVCLTCREGFYYDNTTASNCNSCPSGCQACTSLLVCTLCLYTYVNNNGSCQTCPLYKYYSNKGEVCESCPAHCQTCVVDGCLTCDAFTSVQTILNVDLCYDICGDGIVIDFQCDIARTALSDGCSDSCEIEPNFNCTYANQTDNTTGVIVNTSACSFIGTVSITVADAKQVIGENNMVLTYKLKPYLSGMPLSSDNQSYLQTVFLLTSSHDIGNFTVSVDETQGTVTFALPYKEDLSSASLTFQVNLALLATSSYVLQYQANASHTTFVSALKQNGCLGQYVNSQSTMLSTVIYSGSFFLAIVGLVLFLVGVLTKELAGLEQMILFQSIFIGLLFSKEKVNMAVLSLKGFQYALAIQLPSSNLSKSSSSGYFLDTNQQSMTGYYIINFFLFLLPLCALIFLLYRLKHKNFPYKAEIGKHLEQFFRGELMLYMSVFNIVPLIVFGKLFLTFQDGFFFWDLFLALISTLIIIYSLALFILKPELSGIFRSAFRVFSESREDETKEACCSCLTARICESKFGEYYIRYAPNHYYLFIPYLIVSSLILVTEPPFASTILIALQGFVLLILIVVKPFFNRIEKLRSVLMFLALMLSNFLWQNIGNEYILPLVLVALCGVHLLVTVLVIVRSLIDQIKRKCNDRSVIVKKMFRVEDQMNAKNNQEKEDIEKETLRDLITRFNQSHCQQMFPIAKIGVPPETQMAEVAPAEAPDQIINEERALKEEVILEEEHEYMRYEKGLSFFDKYGKDLSNDLVKQHYDEI